jgi:hypothetical protein
MKSFIKKNYYRLLVFIATGLMFASCSDMNELSDKFLDEGALIYAAKVDSVATHPGFNKIELEFIVKTQRIETLQIFWNNGENHVEIQVGNTPGTYRKIIENLSEDTHVFNIVSIDSYGNKSLPVEVLGKAYGDNYKQSRTERIIRDIEVEGDNGVITWNTSTPEDLVYTEVRYITTSDETNIVRILPEETQMICLDAKRNVPIECHSAYLPPDGIDVVETDWTTSDRFFPIQRVRIDKTGWVVTFSDEAPGYPAAAMI